MPDTTDTFLPADLAKVLRQRSDAEIAAAEKEAATAPPISAERLSEMCADFLSFAAEYRGRAHRSVRVSRDALSAPRRFIKSITRVLVTNLASTEEELFDFYVEQFWIMVDAPARGAVRAGRGFSANHESAASVTAQGLWAGTLLVPILEELLARTPTDLQGHVSLTATMRAELTKQLEHKIADQIRTGNAPPGCQSGDSQIAGALVAALPDTYE